MIPLSFIPSIETSSHVAAAASVDAGVPRLGRHAFVDKSLGYAGRDRFVLFYYDARLHEVRWRDSHSCGTGCSGWPPPLAAIESHAASAGITLGHHNEPGDHVLLVDREQGQACFVYREEAQEFLRVDAHPPHNACSSAQKKPGRRG